jgi:hypothetical protein
LADSTLILLRMVNVSVILTSLTVYGAVYYLLGTMNQDLVKAGISRMAGKVRRGLLFLFMALGFLGAFEGLLGAGGPGWVVYPFNLIGQGLLLPGVWQFYGFIKPRVNLPGATDEEVVLSQELAGGG